MAKPEKFVIENTSISDLIKEDFLEKLKKINNNIFPVSLFFISEKKDGNIKQAFPLILSHQNSEEVQNKKIHIESPDTELVESVAKLIEKNEK